MSRVKRGKTSLKRRRKVLKAAKGYRWQRSKKERAAREAILHAAIHSFGDRRKKKRTMRALWNIKIGASARAGGISYSSLINKLKKEKISLDRKILSELAEHNPETFDAVLKEAVK